MMLLRIILIISCLAALLLYALGIISSAPLMLPVFFGCAPALFLCWAVSCVVSTLFVDKSMPCTVHSPLFRFHADCIIGSILRLLRVKMRIKGMKMLPEESFLLVSNHRSSLDPFVEMGALSRYHMGFVAKEDLFDIPVIGKVMHKSFCIPLNRDNPREGLKAMNMAANLIKKQEASIGIYPEGTRNCTDQLLPFKSGAFKIAKKAGCPVVVAVVRNTEKVRDNAPFKRTEVTLEFVQVISKEDVISGRTEQLSARACQAMTGALESQR